MLNIPSELPRPLRVAFATPPLFMGGADQWLLDLCRAFVAAQPVGLAVLPYAGQEEHWRGLDRKTEVVRRMERLLPVHDAIDPRAAIRAACQGADVLVAWGLAQLPAAVRDLGLPVVAVAHAPRGDALQPSVVEGCVRGAHYLAAVSHEAARTYPEAVRAGVAVLPNGADPGRCCPRRGREATRRDWALAEDERLLLWVGRWSAEKRPELVLEALRHLPPQYRALMIGHDYSGDGIAETLCAEAAKYLPGRVMRAPVMPHLGDLYAAADVLVAPSDYESHGLAINEAWLAGLPVVTTEHPTQQDFARTHGRPLSWLVPVRPSGEQLATGVRRALAAEERPAGVEPVVDTDYSRQVAWQHYTSAAMAARWEAYLAGVIADWARHALSPPLRLFGRPEAASSAARPEPAA